MANQPTPATLQPPPDLPNLPKTEDGLVSWLRTFSLWCRHGFSDKLPAGQALPGILLTGYDTAGNPTNLTYRLTIKNGAVTLTQVGAGGGLP